MAAQVRPQTRAHSLNASKIAARPGRICARLAAPVRPQTRAHSLNASKIAAASGRICAHLARARAFANLRRGAPWRISSTPPTPL